MSDNNREALAWRALTESFIDEYLADYEMRGEAEDGRDACYTPTEGDRALIKDAVMGLLNGAECAALAAQAAPVMPLAVFQHDETARLTCVQPEDATHFAEHNPRWHRINWTAAPSTPAQSVPAEGPVAGSMREALTDERIDKIAGLVVRGMEDGIRGFLKTWGWQQFARALADVLAAPSAPAQAGPTDAEMLDWWERHPDAVVHGRGYLGSPAVWSALIDDAWTPFSTLRDALRAAMSATSDAKKEN